MKKLTELSEDLECVQKRALEIAFSNLKYEEVFRCDGIDTLFLSHGIFQASVKINRVYI